MQSEQVRVAGHNREFDDTLSGRVAWDGCKQRVVYDLAYILKRSLCSLENRI